MDQRELVERARRGDHDAFAGLVDAALARLDAAARLILRDPELARDAVQEALIRAWRDLAGLRDPDRFDAWLHRLTVNACLDLARRRRRRPSRSRLTPIEPAASDVAGALADRELVDAALRRLDPGHRAVVAMHYLLGMPLPEVAAALGIPARDRQVPAALRARRDAPGRDRRARPGPDAGLRRAGRMTTESRFERHLPAILEDLYLGPTPDYRDEVLAIAPARRSAPAWTFPGRWLPMADIASRPAFRHAMPVAGVAVAAHRRRAPRRGRGLRRLADTTPAAVRRRPQRRDRLRRERRHLRRGSGHRPGPGHRDGPELDKSPSSPATGPVSPSGARSKAVPPAEDIVVVKPERGRRRHNVVHRQAPGGAERLEWSPDGSILATA